MRLSLPALALALAVTLPATAAERLEGWTQGEATIFTHTPDGPMRVGQVQADGSLVFEWPSVPSTEQTLALTFPSCDDDGSPIATPGAAEFWPTSLFIGTDDSVDGELGSLHLASSPEVVAWQASYGQENAADGTWFQYVHVSQAASMEAQCRMPTYTGEGDDQYTQVTEYNVYFKAGWNLMRNDITRLHAAPSGRRHAASIRISVQEGPAADARWFFRAY